METELKSGIKTTKAKSRKEWRRWLEKNHKIEKSVWLIIYHKEWRMPSVYYNEAVEEALCFGWIDSKPNNRDDKSYYLFFAQRKPKSNWSKANRQRAEKMIAEGLMTEEGQKRIDSAKRIGTWEALEEVQKAIMPTDLLTEFTKNKIALKNYEAFPPSSKRIILIWILTAKKQETREKRIKETVELAAINLKANHYRQ